MFKVVIILPSFQSLFTLLSFLFLATCPLQVKPHQEYVVKVKNFLPPRAEEPEIHILEISEELLRYAPSLSNILASDNEFSDSQTHGAASQPSSRLQHYELFRKLDKSVSEAGENELDGNVEGG